MERQELKVADELFELLRESRHTLDAIGIDDTLKTDYAMGQYVQEVKELARDYSDRFAIRCAKEQTDCLDQRFAVATIGRAIYSGLYKLASGLSQPEISLGGFDNFRASVRRVSDDVASLEGTGVRYCGIRSH